MFVFIFQANLVSTKKNTRSGEKSFFIRKSLVGLIFKEMKCHLKIFDEKSIF